MHNAKLKCPHIKETKRKASKRRFFTKIRGMYKGRILRALFGYYRRCLQMKGGGPNYSLLLCLRISLNYIYLKLFRVLHITSFIYKILESYRVSQILYNPLDYSRFLWACRTPSSSMAFLSFLKCLKDMGNSPDLFNVNTPL